MYQRAIYFKQKFIRNGIAGVAMSSLLICLALNNTETFLPGLIIFPVATLMWLFFGIWISKKLKEMPDQGEALESNQKADRSRQVEFILSLLIALVLILSLNHWKFVNYIAVPILSFYTLWIIWHMNLLNKYFKS